MSATTSTTAARELPRKSSRTPSPRDTPVLLQILVSGAIASDVAILAGGLWLSRHSLLDVGWDLGAWMGVVLLVGLAAVAADSGPELGMDMPLLLAAGFLFGPVIGGAIAFVGYGDIREFQGQIPLIRALYNRAQTSLSVMASAAVFLAVGGQVGGWPRAALAAMAALAADCLVNYAMVIGVVMLHGRVAFRPALSQLLLGSPGGFAVTYACFGFLSLLLAEIYLKLGLWGLASFVIPVLLARQAFAQSYKLDRADKQIESQRHAIQEVSTRMADERRDERLAVAAGLHDEVLPAMYQVHLMGQVLRRDLAAGRLLDLEDDLPELLAAAEEASDTMRGLIRDLRRSALGTRGLVETIRLLARDIEAGSSIRVELDLEEVQGAPVMELLAYQVLREALRNAARHSGGSRVSLLLRRDGPHIRLVVEDDGCGFEPRLVDRQSHFGLVLIRERVELSGGVLQVDSTPGAGTRVIARLPAGV